MLGVLESLLACTWSFNAALISCSSPFDVYLMVVFKHFHCVKNSITKKLLRFCSVLFGVRHFGQFWALDVRISECCRSFYNPALIWDGIDSQGIHAWSIVSLRCTEILCAHWEISTRNPEMEACRIHQSIVWNATRMHILGYDSQRSNIPSFNAWSFLWFLFKLMKVGFLVLKLLFHYFYSEK